MKKETLTSLKNCREKAGLTQKAVEASLNLRSLTIRDYESGRLKLPFCTAIDLAKLYKVDLIELSGESTQDKCPSTHKYLTHFSSLFEKNGVQLISSDPILKAYVEDHQDEASRLSLFELLVINEGQKKKETIALTIMRLLFALAECDGKISNEEIFGIRTILHSFRMDKKYKKITEGKFTFDEMLEKLNGIEIRHFTIWALFLFAHADNEFNYDEMNFIEKSAEALKINKSNFIFIKNNFIKGDD